MADRWGRKRILVPSLFLFGVAGVACGFAGSFHALVLLRFAQGVGAARSRVEWNTDIPSNALRLTEILAHEAYPGHHTEAMLKDKLLYQEKGFAEEAVITSYSIHYTKLYDHPSSARAPPIRGYAAVPGLRTGEL